MYNNTSGDGEQDEEDEDDEEFNRLASHKSPINSKKKNQSFDKFDKSSSSANTSTMSSRDLIEKGGQRGVDDVLLTLEQEIEEMDLSLSEQNKNNKNNNNMNSDRERDRDRKTHDLLSDEDEVELRLDSLEDLLDHMDQMRGQDEDDDDEYVHSYVHEHWTYITLLTYFTLVTCFVWSCWSGGVMESCRGYLIYLCLCVCRGYQSTISRAQIITTILIPTFTTTINKQQQHKHINNNNNNAIHHRYGVSSFEVSPGFFDENFNFSYLMAPLPLHPLEHEQDLFYDMVHLGHNDAVDIQATQQYVYVEYPANV